MRRLWKHVVCANVGEPIARHAREIARQRRRIAAHVDEPAAPDRRTATPRRRKTAARPTTAHTSPANTSSTEAAPLFTHDSAESDGKEGNERPPNQTGGFLVAANNENLQQKYGDIEKDLRAQYAILYQITDFAKRNEWRRIHVQLNSPKLTARTIRGYFARSGSVGRLGCNGRNLDLALPRNVRPGTFEDVTGTYLAVDMRRGEPLSPPGRGQGEGSDVAPSLAVIGVGAGSLDAQEETRPSRSIATDPIQGWRCAGLALRRHQRAVTCSFEDGGRARGSSESAFLASVP